MLLKRSTRRKAKRILSLVLVAVMSLTFAAIEASPTLAVSTYYENGKKFSAFSSFDMYKYVRKKSADELVNGTGDVYNGPAVNGVDSKQTTVGTKDLVSNKRGVPDNWDPSKFGILILNKNQQRYLSKTVTEKNTIGSPATQMGNGAFYAFDPDRDEQYLLSLENLPVIIPRSDFSYDGTSGEITYNITYGDTSVNGKRIVPCTNYLIQTKYQNGSMGYDHLFYADSTGYSNFKFVFSEDGTCQIHGKRGTEYDTLMRYWPGQDYFVNYPGTPERKDDLLDYYIYFAYEVKNAGARAGGVSAPSSPVTYKISAGSVVSTPSTAQVAYIDKNVTLNVYGTLVIDTECYLTGTLNVFGNLVIKDGGILHTSYAGERGTVNVYGGKYDDGTAGGGCVTVLNGGDLSIETDINVSRLNLYTGTLSVDGTLSLRTEEIGYAGTKYISCKTTVSLIKFTDNGKLYYRKHKSSTKSDLVLKDVIGDSSKIVLISPQNANISYYIE